jgi:tRNA (guanine10-N2)-methyltransferase
MNKGCQHLYDDGIGIVQPTLVPHESILQGRSRFLFIFLHHLLDFRLPEIAAHATAYDRDTSSEATTVIWEEPIGPISSPYWYAHLPSIEVAAYIASKSLLTRVVLDPWAEADTLEDLLEAVRQYPQELKAPFQQESESFKFIIEAWGKTISLEERISIINKFVEPTAFQGRVDLQHPQHQFWIVWVDADFITEGIPKLPGRWYFGRQISLGGDRSILQRYALPNRKYLGPTSMDPELAFLMAIQGGARKGSIAMDPFVGTGSVLVACAHYGAYTLGVDIDARVIKLGKTDSKGQSVNGWTNFRDYSLPPPIGLLMADLNNIPFRSWNIEGLLDAIVCDPPYGVRAGGKKLSSDRAIKVYDKATHIPKKDPYSMGECLKDLVEFGAKTLAINGRLVFWLPAADGYYKEEELPCHPSMELIANSEQILTSKYSRRLLTMKKVKTYDAILSEEHWNKVGLPCPSLEKIRDFVMDLVPDGEGGTRSSNKGAIRRYRCKNV